MEGGVNLRNWADLLPDALGLIFSHLSLQETLTIVPRVCKSWNQAVLGPYCWQNINILDWSYRSNPEHIDQMLRLLVTRSGGAFREITVSGILNDLTFLFLADHDSDQSHLLIFLVLFEFWGTPFGYASARSLHTLQIPRCNISDTIVEQLSTKLSAVTFMDLSYCCKITARALSAVGKSCKALVGFRRNMHPIDIKERRPQAEEALAIAATMHKLKHLELAYNCIDTKSVVEIIERCKELEFLDIRGCWDVKFEEDWLEKRAPTVKVLGPHIVDQFEGHSCSDYSDTDSLIGGRLELRFYERFGENYSNGWA
ncbi:F-box domain, cyclin-like protein [Artemisia annua]|uniref:F-box domain, cyclin-like protein n=1 Tax=Artemisia annua TaxID=35608 RepID=A0A2U1KGM0_ARTAN|nr:F-box domain, cyclin-like protein [Artemisia annua]